MLAVASGAVAWAGAFDRDGVSLVAIALLYTALWTGLFTATAVAARSRREAAPAYGGMWMLLVVLAPTLMSERALSSSIENAGLTAALDQRAQQWESYGQDRAEHVERTMIWSPMVALTLAIERLAASDLEAAAAFRSEAVKAVAERVDWVVEQAWRDTPLTLEDFEALAAGSPSAVRAPPADVTPHLTVLSAWTVIAWAVGAVRIRRRETEI